jgi:NADH-quinone oxidoreductase subunit C
MSDGAAAAGATGMDEALKALGEAVVAARPGVFQRAYVGYGELNLIAEAGEIAAALTYLRDDPRCLFTCLIDITAVDYPVREKRFDVVYHLLSPHRNQRVRIKAAVAEDEGLPSVVPVFPAADWFERETWDMFGVYFTGHPDLRRLLTDYGFIGHPFRKDFPLSGNVEVRYDPEKKRVVYQPVSIEPRVLVPKVIREDHRYDDALKNPNLPR